MKMEDTANKKLGLAKLTTFIVVTFGGRSEY